MRKVYEREEKKIANVTTNLLLLENYETPRAIAMTIQIALSCFVECKTPRRRKKTFTKDCSVRTGAGSTGYQTRT
jgi:hypothetical protein